MTSQVSAGINRHDVNQRENKHPNEVDEVPVKAADLNIFMLQLLDSPGNHRQVNCAGGDVEHVQSGDSEKSSTEKWCRWHTFCRAEDLHPVLGQVEGPEPLMDQVLPLNQVEDDERQAEEYRRQDPLSCLSFVAFARC